jgi:hypothetical protein
MVIAKRTVKKELRCLWETRSLTHLETIFWQVKNMRTMMTVAALSTPKLAYDYDVVVVPVP